MNFHEDIIIAAKEESFLRGAVEQAYFKHLDKYSFHDTHNGIAEFLKQQGFEVAGAGTKSSHHYAVTKDNIYLSSNGYIYYTTVRRF
jgi:poly-D-alanine transfer protein DltD